MIFSYCYESIITEDLFYHCGLLSKDSGNKINTITNVLEKDVYLSLINVILNNNDMFFKNIIPIIPRLIIFHSIHNINAPYLLHKSAKNTPYC